MFTESEVGRNHATHSTRYSTIVLVLAFVFGAALRASASALPHERPLAAGDITGTISDSTSGQPLQSAEVSVSQSGNLIVNTQTDGFGRYTVHNLGAGSYVVSARMIGFRPLARTVTVPASGGDVTNVDFHLVPAAVNLSTVRVTASVPIAVDTRTGNQVFQQNEYHGAPTNTTSQILQLSIAGAARAPTGEVHIRGQHAEYTYYVDGVPVPSGISGSLNELFDPEIVNQINFQTGGWDAEYGNKNAAIVNVTTKIPAGGFHSDLGTYLGTYGSSTAGDRGFNGQSLSMSTNTGPWGFYVSGARQFSDMRVEPVILDPSSDKIENFHNQGTDYFGFGKIQFTPSTHDALSLDLSSSRTRFQVPYDTSGNTLLDDHQTDVNSFANLGWRHQFGSTSQSQSNNADLFAGLFYRHGTLDYVPGAHDTPQFVFYPDPNQYNVAENRQFNTFGLKLDYTTHPGHDLEFKVGTQTSTTNGHEDFVTTDANGNNGPSSRSGLKGWDAGVYAQTAYSPIEQFELRTGVRYDAHNAPFAGTQSQVSPRIRLNFFPSPSTTLYAYYGRLFMPTNVEDLRAITSVAQGDTATSPTLPERDNFYELGLVQRLPAGMNFKLSAYYKDSKPGIDDNTVPGSAIVTSVNIERVKITGIESVIEYRPQGPFSAYVNAALNHAYGSGAITGGFFPVTPPSGTFDLDHDQRLSLVASGTYSFSQLYFSGTGIYGSGLTNGVDPASCDCSYGTGLFDFNRGIHVPASTIFNFSAGYSLVAGSSVVRPELYIENVFDKKYLLKGAFFSGASVGRPRNIQLRVNVGL
ncbi:MAG TPA: TonB-dependent receptor [Gemmatimonadaceae bacterium]|jgi:outer membrane receptor protein involved in Fe transport